MNAIIDRKREKSKKSMSMLIDDNNGSKRRPQTSLNQTENAIHNPFTIAHGGSMDLRRDHKVSTSPIEEEVSVGSKFT